MLDIHFIRDNAELVNTAAKKKHIRFTVEPLIKLDDERRKLIKEIEEKKAKQNVCTEKIATGVVAGEEREKLIGELRALKEEISAGEEKLKKVFADWREQMLLVPNIPDMSVPDGEDDSGNEEVRTWGEKRKPNQTPKPHHQIMQELNLVDFERGAKVAGFRGYFLKGDAVRLNFALWQFTLDMLGNEGFLPMMAPILDRREAFMGTGYLPGGEEDLYKTQDDTFLAGTAEVPMMAYYMDEVIPGELLPLKFISFSPCYRREAGAHGKDTKGLVRVHEFFKLEQIILSEASHQTSVDEHEKLTANAERIMQRLNLPYRVVVNCGGDLGQGQVKKYDIEAWVPSEYKYRETHSSSYFHDFQTRRLNIRYRDKQGKLRFVHSLNNTALATPRLLVPLIEQYYDYENRRIIVPEVLEKYVGKKFIEK